MNYDDAFAEGFNAYMDGESLEDNPFGWDEPGFEAWESGWHEASDEDVED